MYVQCPECLTVYKVETADLAGAHGNVRCGHCNAVFDGLATLAAELPSEPIGRLPAHASLPQPPQLGLPVYRPNPNQGTLFSEPERRRRSGAAPAAQPGFARRRARIQPARAWPWLAGSTFLLIALAAQLAWAQRAQWFEDPALRPWLDGACNALGCHLPLRHDLAALALVSRDIRPHPSVPDALIISATVRNRAPFAQAFPVVGITLSDLDDNRVAMRRFQPREYLDDNRVVAAGLAPGASAALVFEVADPGHDAVAFQFDFE
jgi:predicted Zn finger-like uncharacterized protein